jgi:murein L,D-transpeptidase YafK
MDETTKIYRERVMNMRKTSVKKNTKTSTKTSEPATSLAEATPEERWKMVAVSAYYKAKERGFSPGNELQDWSEAEKEIDQLMLG